MIHETVDQLTLNYKLTNLYVSGIYSIRVAALNSQYTGAYAETGNVTAKSQNNVPNKPTGPILLKNITRETVDAHWREPIENGSSPLQSYFIEKRDSKENIWIKVARVEPHIKSLKIANLVEGESYQLRVTAENIFGESEPLYSSTFRPLRSYGYIILTFSKI